MKKRLTRQQRRHLSKKRRRLAAVGDLLLRRAAARAVALSGDWIAQQLGVPPVSEDEIRAFIDDQVPLTSRAKRVLAQCGQPTDGDRA